MNFKAISDSDLLKTTKRLASEERRIGIEVLHHLREIDVRKLFATIGYPSLFAYCTVELGYSEGGAYRRISAMRLLRDVPEYEAKLQSGEVSVATLSRVQSFLTQEKRQSSKTYSQDEKLKLLSMIEGKSSQQTERVLAAISPQAAREEKTRAINDQETEIRFTAGFELMAKIEKLRNLLGHKAEAQTYAGLIDEIATIAIQKLDPSAKPGKQIPEKPSHLSAEQLLLVEVVKPEETVAVKNKQSRYIPIHAKNAQSRYIPVLTKRAVWQRDQGQCTYVDQRSGRRCESRHALELDHVRPFAKGGLNITENLRLLCPAHNQIMAINAYGMAAMRRYWSK